MRKLMLLATALLISAFSATAQQINDDSGYPTIQDTFFGMKMGSRLSRTKIKINFNHKGEVCGYNYVPSGVLYYLDKVIFSGTTWEHGNLYLSDKRVFYRFRVYITSQYGEELYESYKNKLAEKYGEGEETITEDEKKIVYTGENDMSVTLYSKSGGDERGSYRRYYVSVDYTQTAIYNRMKAANDDEL